MKKLYEKDQLTFALLWIVVYLDPDKNAPE